MEEKALAGSILISITSIGEYEYNVCYESVRGTHNFVFFLSSEMAIIQCPEFLNAIEVKLWSPPRSLNHCIGYLDKARVARVISTVEIGNSGKFEEKFNEVMPIKPQSIKSISPCKYQVSFEDSAHSTFEFSVEENLSRPVQSTPEFERFMKGDMEVAEPLLEAIKCFHQATQIPISFSDDSDIHK